MNKIEIIAVLLAAASVLSPFIVYYSIKLYKEIKEYKMSNKDSVIIGKIRAKTRFENQERRKIWDNESKNTHQRARGKYRRYSKARDTRDNRFHFGNYMPIAPIRGLQ
jgi:hypothetical protein